MKPFESKGRIGRLGRIVKCGMFTWLVEKIYDDQQTVIKSLSLRETSFVHICSQLISSVDERLMRTSNKWLESKSLNLK